MSVGMVNGLNSDSMVRENERRGHKHLLPVTFEEAITVRGVN